MLEAAMCNIVAAADALNRIALDHERRIRELEDNFGTYEPNNADLEFLRAWQTPSVSE